MIKEFFESLKIKDIVFFVLFIVLFCMVLKKNKKENFGSTSEISQENLIAINNLGELVKNISNTSGQLTLNNLVIKDGNENVNVLEKLKAIQGSVSNDRADFDNHVDNFNTTLNEYQLASNLNEDIKKYLLSQKFKFKSGGGISDGVVWSNFMSGTDNEKYLAARPGHNGDYHKFTTFVNL